MTTTVWTEQTEQSPGFVGTDLIDEDFAPDPGWTEVGNSSVNSANVLSNTISGADAYSYQTYTDQTEVWCEAEFTIDSATIVTNGQAFGLIGFSEADDSMRVDLNLSGGAIKFRIVIKNEDTSQTVIITTEELVVGKRYNMIIQFKAATVTGASDGIAKVWLDNTLIVDRTNIANFGQVAGAIVAGGLFASGTASAVQVTHWVKVGTTGSPPIWVEQTEVIGA